MRVIHFHIVFETEKPDTAQRLGCKAATALGADVVSFEPYHKGGSSVFMRRESKAGWADLTQEVIALAQLVGREIYLTGHISDELGLVVNRASMVGINWAHISVQREK